MNLTERARMMLTQARWHPRPRDRAQIMAMLEAQKVPAFEPVIIFQERYGGLHLGTLLLGYIEKDGDVAAFGYDDEDGHYYLYCADDLASAPVTFFLNEEGTFYVGAYPIAERIETYIEWFALTDEMTRRRGWHHATIGYVARDDYRIDEVVNLPPIPEASDRYLRCWGDEHVRIIRMGNFYKGDHRDDIDIYARRRFDLRVRRDQLDGIVQREMTKSSWRELLDILRSR